MSNSRNIEEEGPRNQEEVSSETLHEIDSVSESVSRIEILLLPTMIALLDFKSLVILPTLCKSSRAVVNTEYMAYWTSVCAVFAHEAGLYSPYLSETGHGLKNLMLSNKVNPGTQNVEAKKHFHSILWPLRHKWPTPVGRKPFWSLSSLHSEAPTVESDVTASADAPAIMGEQFSVRVVCRFRPGEITKERFSVPLHQFLKVKRKQIANANASGNNENQPQNTNTFMVGSAEPEHFLDPFLGTLMREPVRLLTSGRVLDRSVAVHCVLRNGRDPFNNAVLKMEHLQPEQALVEEIEQWKLVRDRTWRENVTLSSADVKPFVDASTCVSGELLQALIDVEKLEMAAKRAEAEASSTERGGHHWSSGSSDPAVQTGEQPMAMDAELLVPEQGGVDADFIEGLTPQDSEAFVRRENSETRSPFGDKRDDDDKVGSKVLEVNDPKATVSMHVHGAGVRPFSFTRVHSGDVNQFDVYERSVRESIVACLNGFNATVLCYGQTGAGKTYTFFGPDGAIESAVPPSHVVGSSDIIDVSKSSGMVVRAMAEVLHAKKKMAAAGISVALSAQYVEIYEEKITDLLTGRSCTVSRTNGEVHGASIVAIADIHSVIDMLLAGQARKKFSATAMNDRSSRSHTALILKVNQSSESCPELMLSSSLHLLDLAGSERVKKSQASGTRLREAVGINSSLLTLGKVIAALVEYSSHVPFFECKLTTLLKGAFVGGHCRTTVIVNCRPEDDHGDETLQSLRFGERCSMISTSVKTLAATSLSDAMEALDRSLETIRGQIDGLKQRGKCDLPSFKSLQGAYSMLMIQREVLVGK